MNSNQLRHALQQAGFYPHPVADITLIETHISEVFLTGDYAYKVKKPMNFGFLDFTTLSQRKHFCEQELLLNSRLAPELYCQVLPITRSENGFALDGRGEIVEYCIQMVQFDNNSTLDKLAERGELNNDIMREIGQHLALFHNSLAKKSTPGTPVEPQPGSPEAVWNPAIENFEQISPFLSTETHIDKLNTIQRWSEQNFNRLQVVIADRKANGFVRECHGDLHLGNMVQTHADNGAQVRFFDCIEFNEWFRQIDTVCELAFTLMDLEARGMPHRANTLLNTYLEFNGDYAGLKLLNFYKVYFAMVRAKVNLLQIGSQEHDVVLQHPLYSEFLKYLQLALSYTVADTPFSAITHGVSGSGKSTLAAKVAAKTGAIRLRSDVERKRLFGLAVNEPSDKSIYTSAASQQTFAKLKELLREVVEAGFSCIVDATFLHAEYRQQFAKLAEELKIKFSILDCHAPDEILLQRLAKRNQEATDASEATADVMRSQQKNQQPLTAVEEINSIRIDMAAEPNIDAIVAKLNR